MAYSLSFSKEFFTGTVPLDEMETSERPTSILQALLSLSDETWNDIASEVFHCKPESLHIDTVLQKICETDTCQDLTPPVEVYVDRDGFYSLLVFDAA